MNHEAEALRIIDNMLTNLDNDYVYEALLTGDGEVPMEDYEIVYALIRTASVAVDKQRLLS